MKFKRVLASVLSAAMILASVPGTGLNAYAAGNGELEIVDDAAEPDAAAELAVEEEIDEPDAADGESVVEDVEDVGNAADDVLTSTQGYENLSLTTGDGGTVVVETGCAQNGYPGTNVLDNNTGTRWHTTWSTNNINAGNAWINFKLNTPSTVAGLLYKLESGAANGYVKIAQVFVKVSGSEEFQKVYETSEETPWTKTDAAQEVVFTPVENVAEVKFAALQSYGSELNRHINAVEMRVMTLPDGAQTVTATAEVENETMGSAYVDIPSAVMDKTSITVLSGVQVKYKAVANEGYDFVGWQDSEGNIVSRDREYVQAVDENTRYTAVFKDYTLQKLDIKSDTIYANSEMNQNNNDGPASWAFNGNTGNWWHSRYNNNGTGSQSGASVSNPIYIQAGFDGAKDVTRILYQSRTTGAGTDNIIKDFEIFAADCEDATPSDDEFVSVMKGTIQNPSYTKEEIIDLPCVVRATHIRIQATSVYGTNNQYVTASKIEMYEETSEDKDVHHIISIADRVSASDSAMGTATVSPAKVVERLDTQVTLTATANAGHDFERWNVTGTAEAPAGANAQITFNSENIEHLEAVFVERDYNNESVFWDAQRAAGTLQTQTAEDIWHYQIKVDGLWSDIPSDDYHSDRWLQNGDSQSSTYHYAKISRDELTSTFSNDSQQAVGYAWKATQSGYYYATLENNISAGGNVKMDLVVTHTASDMLQADGKTLLTQEVGNGENFTSRIARVEAGDYIRIGARKRNAWVSGFVPVIVPVTVKEYAEQYAADVETILETNPYTEESAAAVAAAKQALEVAIASETDIETRITALEDAVNVADITLSRRYNAPVMGSAIAMTDEDKAFYDLANTLSVDVVLKYDTVPTTGSNLALFTLSDGQGEYITVWHNPVAGRISFAANGTRSDLAFTENKWKVTDTDWHKFTVSINTKNGYFYVIKDGNTASGVGNNNGAFLGWDSLKTWQSGNAWTPVKSLFYGHQWSVNEILVGKKAANSSNNNNASLTDAAENSGIQVKYIEVSGRSYTGADDINTRSNSKADTAVKAELDALLEENLDGTGYTADSWAAYEAALTAARSAQTDWERCNAIDTLQTAKAALTADKTQLQTLIEKAQRALQMADGDPKYSAASLEAMTEPYTQANTVYQNEQATGEEIIAAAQALKEALDNLVRLYKVSIAGAGEGVTMTYENGEYANEAGTEVYVPLVTKVKVTAPAENDSGAFRCWMLNQKTVCYTTSYTFYVTSDTEFTTEYVEGEIEQEQEPTILCSAYYASGKVKLTAKRSVPDQYEVVRHGVVITNEKGWTQYLNSDENNLVEGAAGTSKSVGTTKGRIGTYVASRTWKQTDAMYARAYVVYKGTDGVEHTKYSELVIFP